MKYRLHWLDGRTEVVEGETIEAAFTAAGHLAGAVRALDHYKPIPADEKMADEDLEVYGDTLDEPLPDDFIDLIQSI